MLARFKRIFHRTEEPSVADRPSTSRQNPTRRRAIGLALGTGAALIGAGTSAGSASAAPAPGTWLDVPVPAETTPHMWAVAAPTRRTAFAVGQHSWTQKDVTGVLHWNGRAWTSEPVPPMQWNWYMDMAAASPRAAWIVGTGLLDQAARSLYWNGARWGTVPFPVEGGGPKVAAEPGGTAWAILGAPQGAPASNALLRFERGAWVRKRSPLADGDVPGAVAARSPRDVWVGARTPDGAGFTLNWDGREWHRHALPSGGATSILPLSRTDVWAYAPEDLLHWDGTAWERVTRAPRYGMFPYPYAGTLVSDGQGGIWLGHLAEATSGHAGYLHWDGAVWTPAFGPDRADAGQPLWAQVTDMAPIPGTRSIWAVGYEGNGWRPFIERFDVTR
jgi:hypothetical protein